MSLPRTPSQTVGPYHAIAMRWGDGAHVVPDGTHGAFWIRGRVLDGDGAPVDDAVIETWQADGDGRFAAEADPPGFRGFGRALTDGAGEWAIMTIRPGVVLAPDGGPQAPHLLLAIYARGLLKPALTRVYFGDDPEANAADAVLATLDEHRRATLIARPAGDGYRFDVRLQGSDETVFFDV